MRALKLRIAIIGYGNIGKSFHEEIAGCKSFNVSIIDPQRDDYEQNKGETYDFGFVAVPTDFVNGKCDISIVEQAIQETNCHIYVIKSAVPPGTSDEIAYKYSKQIVYSPEYYGLTKDACRELPFVILGGEPYARNRVAEMYSYCKKGAFKCIFTTRKTGELAKYMENCFLAMKVTFCAEFADVAKSIGVEYPELRELFNMDERNGPSHTFVYPDQPYYDSHCFNKDVPAILEFAKEKKVTMPIIYAMHQSNLKRKED